MIELSFGTALILAKSFVDPNPDYIYIDENGISAKRSSNCKYVHHYGTEDAAPGCIAGKILHAVGFSLNELHEMEDSSVDDAGCHLDIEFSDKTSRFLEVLQVKQDLGYTWGDSLAAALDAVDGL